MLASLATDAFAIKGEDCDSLKAASVFHSWLASGILTAQEMARVTLQNSERTAGCTSRRQDSGRAFSQVSSCRDGWRRSFAAAVHATFFLLSFCKALRQTGRSGRLLLSLFWGTATQTFWKPQDQLPRVGCRRWWHTAQSLGSDITPVRGWEHISPVPRVMERDKTCPTGEKVC